MKEVWLIRHAESAANAGAATSFTETIGLTEKGLRQAQFVASCFDKQPDLIALSPYLRAKQTAAPLQQRYPQTISRHWQVQEFTYLARQRCLNTTVTERKPLVAAYWMRNKPSYCDGVGAESFAEFILRARSAIEQIKAENSGFIALFTHAQFIQAMMWLLWHKVEDIEPESMSAFRTFNQGVVVPNAAIVKMRLMPDEGELYFSGVKTSHLPADLITL